MSKFERFPNQIHWDSQLIKVGASADSDIELMQNWY